MERINGSTSSVIVYSRIIFQLTVDSAFTFPNVTHHHTPEMIIVTVPSDLTLINLIHLITGIYPHDVAVSLKELSMSCCGVVASQTGRLVLG